MKKRTLLRSSILIVLVLLVVAGGNARALSQLTVYLPIVVDGTAESPSPTTPPPSTTEPTTIEPPPPTTEPPPPTTEPPPSPTGNIVIRDIFFDGVIPTTEADEYVEIRNDDNIPIQLDNWTLRDAQSHVFTFPSFVIQPNQTCRIYTNQVHSQWCGFSCGSGQAIWNNTGDTGTLRDGNGTLIDEYSY